MTGSDSSATFLSKEQIESSVQRVLGRLGVDCYRGINPVEVANLMGLGVYNAEFEDPTVAGALIQEGEDFRILVKASDNIERKRFTVAHELGHFVLHRNLINSEFVDNQETLLRSEQGEGAEFERIEYQANFFAASLLMPKVEVKKLLSDGMSIEDTASLFGVSPAAMRIRATAIRNDV